MDIPHSHIDHSRHHLSPLSSRAHRPIYIYIYRYLQIRTDPSFNLTPNLASGPSLIPPPDSPSSMGNETQSRVSPFDSATDYRSRRDEHDGLGSYLFRTGPDEFCWMGVGSMDGRSGCGGWGDSNSVGEENGGETSWLTTCIYLVRSPGELFAMVGWLRLSPGRVGVGSLFPFGGWLFSLSLEIHHEALRRAAGFPWVVFLVVRCIDCQTVEVHIDSSISSPPFSLSERLIRVLQW
jgi:hypothetical protein